MGFRGCRGVLGQGGTWGWGPYEDLGTEWDFGGTGGFWDMVGQVGWGRYEDLGFRVVGGYWDTVGHGDGGHIRIWGQSGI